MIIHKVQTNFIHFAVSMRLFTLAIKSLLTIIKNIKLILKKLLINKLTS